MTPDPTPDDSRRATIDALRARLAAVGSDVPAPAEEAADQAGVRPAAGEQDAAAAPELTREQADFDTAARTICLRQLTAAARSRAQLAEALRKRGIPEDSANRVLDRYVEVGLIDDAAYAEALVRSRHRERGLGRRSLAQELRRKGIDQVHAVPALDQIDDEDERERAEALVAKKLRSALAAGPDAARRRLLGMLARRGYPSSLAYGVVTRALTGAGLDEVLPPEE